MREFMESLFIAVVSGVIAELTSHVVVASVERLRKRHNKKPDRNKLRPHRLSGPSCFHEGPFFYNFIF